MLILTNYGNEILASTEIVGSSIVGLTSSQFLFHPLKLKKKKKTLYQSRIKYYTSLKKPQLCLFKKTSIKLYKGKFLLKLNFYDSIRLFHTWQNQKKQEKSSMSRYSTFHLLLSEIRILWFPLTYKGFPGENWGNKSGESWPSHGSSEHQNRWRLCHILCLFILHSKD